MNISCNEVIDIDYLSQLYNNIIFHFISSIISNFKINLTLL